MSIVLAANQIPQENREDSVVTVLLVKNARKAVENSVGAVEKMGNLWGKGGQKNKNYKVIVLVASDRRKTTLFDDLSHYLISIGSVAALTTLTNAD